MKIQRFEDIIAWQKAQDLAVDVYKTYSGLKDFAFKDQIQRAAISISNNIAEGFERQGDKEFIRFLYVSLASCSEVKSMLYLSNRLKFTRQEETDNLINQSNEVSKIITGLIKYLKSSLQSDSRRTK